MRSVVILLSIAGTANAAPTGSVALAKAAKLTAKDATVPTPKEPMAEKVLPAGEAMPLNRVVIGKGWRFQLPNNARKSTENGVDIFTSIDDAVVPPTGLVQWATVEDFTGDTAAFVKAQKKAALAEANAVVDAEKAVTAMRAGKSEPAQTFTVRTKDRIDQMTFVATGKKGYVFHCAVPNITNAWSNASSSCEAYQAHFHVEPPAK